MIKYDKNHFGKYDIIFYVDMFFVQIVLLYNKYMWQGPGRMFKFMSM